MVNLLRLNITVDGAQVDGASRKLDVLAVAGGRAEGAIARLRSGVAKLIAVYASWKTVEITVEKFISQTIESERAQALLANAVRSTGGAAGLSATELQKMASGLQRVSVYGDETIMSAETMLLTFTRVGRDVFPKALQAALDLSTVMGTDLPDAAKTIGRALNDPVKGLTALGRMGVQFDATEKQNIKTMLQHNQVAEAQGVILDKLSSKFGGAARAARGTLGGALQALSESWGDLFELSGPRVDDLTSSIERLIDKMSSPDTTAAIQQLGINIFNAMGVAVQGIINASNNVQWLLDKFADLQDKSDRGLHTARIEAQNTATSLENANQALQQSLAARDLRNPFGVNSNAIQGQIDQNAKRVQEAIDQMAEIDRIFNGRTSSRAVHSATGLASGALPPKGQKPFVTDDQVTAAEKARISYEKLLASNQQYISQQTLEASVLGMTEEKASALRHQQELMNKAVNDNIQLTPTRIEQLNADADAMAAAEERTRRLTEAYTVGKETFTGFFSDLAGGLKSGSTLFDSFADAGSKALDSLAQKALDFATSGVWDVIFSALTGGVGGGLRPGFQAGVGGLLGGALIPGILHDGGIAGVDGYGHGRTLSSSLWMGARRYHNGGIAGLAPDEVPAILQRGERVIPANANTTPAANTNHFHFHLEGATREAVSDVKTWVKSGGFANEVRRIMKDPHRSN